MESTQCPADTASMMRVSLDAAYWLPASAQLARVCLQNKHVHCLLSTACALENLECSSQA